MTRRCKSYEGYDCPVSLEGRHPNCERCNPCKKENNRIKRQEAWKREKAIRLEAKATQYDARELYPVRVL